MQFNFARYVARRATQNAVTVEAESLDSAFLAAAQALNTSPELIRQTLPYSASEWGQI